jgi:4-hydroxy-tetrahydrodipicolinate synthase
MAHQRLKGIFAAALTPLRDDFSPDYEAIPQLLSFLAKRGCHGALLLGTTGEGPSFDTQERKGIFQAGLEIREAFSEFQLFAGTSTPSLTETIGLTRTAFDLGYDGVVVLPPYYYHQATEEGLFDWYEKLIFSAVPEDGSLFGYHIPAQSGVPLPLDLLSKLKDQYPDRFAGIKDSSGDPAFAQTLGKRFGDDLAVLTGNDALLPLALENHASGCITALANLFSPDLRLVWDAYMQGEKAPEAQNRLETSRKILSQYSTYPASLKALIAKLYRFPLWPVRPPLTSLSEVNAQRAIRELEKSGLWVD